MDCPVYFLTACTLERRAILANQEFHAAFVNFGGNASTHGVLVGRYVIMPDHLHLFAAFGPDSLSLSEWIRALKRALAKELRQMGTARECWQKGFFDHVMRSEESYEQKWLYVVQNPVRAGLVQGQRDWPYQGEIYPLTVRSL